MMVDHFGPTKEELISSVKGALKHNKSAFDGRISNGHKLRDLNPTSNRLLLSYCSCERKVWRDSREIEIKIAELHPMLQHCMIQAKSAIDLWLLPRMTKLHLWMVVFDLPMAREDFNLPHKEILGEIRYGLEVEEKPGSVVISFFQSEKGMSYI